MFCADFTSSEHKGLPKMAKALLLRRPGCLAAFILLGLASSTAYVEASAGDAQTIFRGCTMFCTDTCNAYPDNGAEDRAMQGFLQDPKFLGDPKLIPGDIGHFSAWQKVTWSCSSTSLSQSC